MDSVSLPEIAHCQRGSNHRWVHHSLANIYFNSVILNNTLMRISAFTVNQIAQMSP